MRFLGFLFFLLLAFVIVGYARGWFSVSTSHAAGKSDVTVGVDNDKIDADARAAASKLGELSAKAADVVKSIGHKVSATESEIEGSVATTDAAARDLTLSTSSGTIELHVPSAVPITRDGTNVGFEELRAGGRLRLGFEEVGESRRLSRVEILP